MSIFKEDKMPDTSVCTEGIKDTVGFIHKVELLKAIAHPVRMMILDELAKGVKCVSDLEEFLKINQPNVSQHLTILRNNGIIGYFMDGRLRCYFLRNPFIPELLELIKKEFAEDLPAPACCPVTKKGTYPGKRNN